MPLLQIYLIECIGCVGNILSEGGRPIGRLSNSKWNVSMVFSKRIHFDPCNCMAVYIKELIMSKNNDVEILETPEYGSFLVCRDAEVANQFEDFLTERCFVLFKVSLDGDKISFFFGQASAPSKVRDLYERFTNENNEN
jgi:hypothetical protein